MIKIENAQLKEIVNHFTSLYSEEIENGEVTEDCVFEWWGMTLEQYGYNRCDGNFSEVYEIVEKAILNAIG